MAWCGRQARQRTAAYRANETKCIAEARFLAQMNGSTTCDIAALLAGRAIGKEAQFYLRLAELSDPVVDWSSWIAGIFGGALAKEFCHR